MDHTPESFPIDFPATLTAIVRAEQGGGYSASIPGLPGCVTEADTLDELRTNLRDAAEGWLKAHYELAATESAGEAVTR